MTFADLVDNEPWTAEPARFAAIIGANPSRGARSPHLWNAAFEAHGDPTRMTAFDVSADNLAPLLERLDDDERFVGGAVAVPHKSAVAQWLGARTTAGAAKAGAVNCLYRVGGRLHGANTDGEGALASIRAIGGDHRGAVVVLGAGGTAGAIVATILSEAEPPRSLVVVARDPTRAGAIQRLGASVRSWGDRGDALRDADLVVNATTAGSTADPASSPLDADDLAALRPTATVFDVVYDPSPTVLVRWARERGLTAGDGVGMNLEQAVIAFGRACSEPRGSAVTRAAMESARTELDAPRRR